MDSHTVVIDNGSGYIKAGLNSSDEPSVIFPTLTGTHRHTDSSHVFVGDEALYHESELSIYHPIDHGHISNWDMAQKIWEYALKCADDKRVATDVLLTEPPLCSTHHRVTMGQMFFEHFGFLNLNMSVSGLMSIYANGITTGLVLDIGEGITQCVPIFDGYIEKNSIARSDFGGEELTMYLQKLICDIGYNMTTRKNFEYVKYMKEHLCFCSLNPMADDLRKDLGKTFTLPNGDILRDGYNQIEIAQERFYVPEALFNPVLCHRDTLSVSELVWKSILSCPIENRKILSSCIVLSGGSTLFPNLRERLELELKNNAPFKARDIVKVYAQAKREIMSWCGSQIFSQPELRPIQDAFWISRDEYEEIGENVFLIKNALKDA